MRRALAIVAGVLFLAALTFSLVVVLGLRFKVPPVVRAVRRINRAITNPRQMTTAGSPGANASIICHAGRKSGKPYETPVEAIPTGDGFVISLPYGTEADWLKNVLASGSATIVDEGETYQVDRPEIIPLEEVGGQLNDQRRHRLFGVDRAVHLRQTEAEVEDADPSRPAALPRAKELL